MRNNICPFCNHIVLPRVNREDYEFVCPYCGGNGPWDMALTEPKFKVMPTLPYVSIDLETTGLNPANCQILEFGAVFDDWSGPISQLKRFQRYILHDQITGEPFALQMNAGILRKIAAYKPGDDGFCPVYQLHNEFCLWLQDCCGLDHKHNITPAGKNFATFDLQFLRPLGFNMFHHRTLDPALLYWNIHDTILPDSKTCMDRAGLDARVAHTALEDAEAVCHMIRRGIVRLGF